MPDEYDFITMTTTPPDGPVCDFCSSPDVHWTYPCSDYANKAEQATAVGFQRDGSLAVESMVIDSFSSGGWACCNACHALIERGRRDKLARRSAKRLLRKNPDLPMSLSNATEHIRRLQDQFWSHREGPPVYHEHRPTEDPTR